MKLKMIIAATAAALSLLSSGAVAAPLSLEGMGQILSWTDREDSADDMPDFIWGTSDADLADRIGIHVEFENGLTGSATYSGVASVWNTSNFAGIAADTATGFFTNAGLLHFLVNSARPDPIQYPEALPMAWTSFVMDFSNNFDISYENQNNSDFRASVAGWGSATFTTYSSTAIDAVPLPATLPLLLGAFGVAGWAGRRKARAA